MSKNKWWASIFGMVVGSYYVYLSTLENSQVMNIKRPIGVLFIAVYLFFGLQILIKKIF